MAFPSMIVNKNEATGQRRSHLCYGETIGAAFDGRQSLKHRSALNWRGAKVSSAAKRQRISSKSLFTTPMTRRARQTCSHPPSPLIAVESAELTRHEFRNCTAHKIYAFQHFKGSHSETANQGNPEEKLPVQTNCWDSSAFKNQKEGHSLHKKVT